MMCVLIFAILAISSPISAVKRGFGPGEEDFGYVTVREKAHMFWWLHHTTANVTDSSERPLILWLAGGPGGSSTAIGNFLTVGLLDETLQPREHNWVKDFNVLFVDNPVGAGYSYVEELHYLSTNNSQITKDLVVVMKEFYKTVPKFKNTPLYIYGISYGGKMGVEFAQAFNKEIELGNVEANLVGVSIGNAWISPVDSVLTWAPFLYQMSLVDEKGRDIIDEQAKYVKEKLDNGQNFHATLEFLRTEQLIQDITDGVDFYNVLTKMPESLKNKINPDIIRNKMIYNSYNTKDIFDLIVLMNGPVKEALNIPEYVEWGMQAGDIFLYLYDDFMLPVVDIVEDLLNNTNVGVHVCNGNMDLIVDTPGQFAWINRLNWKNKMEFANAPRTTTWVNNTMEGYLKEGGGLWFYWLNVAGHSALIENVHGTRAFLKTMTGF